MTDKNKRERTGCHLSKETILVSARRMAFIARFIVLRENKRSKAHRKIEQLSWSNNATAEELAEKIRLVFKLNGDNLISINRDLRRALEHASPASKHFVEEYAQRSCNTFIEAIEDYERSNHLLFEGQEAPRCTGWRNPAELRKALEHESA